MDTIAQDNIACLQQGIDLLRKIDAETYNKPVVNCFNSTIGGHLRHNIDHYSCFLDGYRKGEVDYDHRERSEGIEKDPAVAQANLIEIAEALSSLEEQDLQKSLNVKMDTGGDENSPWSGSTVRRELQFLLSHTIHHYALIATLCRLLGVEPQKEFGVAPSTLRFHKGCAQN